jgi:hypothetical protein
VKRRHIVTLGCKQGFLVQRVRLGKELHELSCLLLAADRRRERA